jgi:hypothetical protein
MPNLVSVAYIKRQLGIAIQLSVINVMVIVAKKMEIQFLRNNINLLLQCGASCLVF